MKPPATVEVDAEIDRLWNQPLSEEEFLQRLSLARAELDGPELENLRSLIEWFTRRYPTAMDRIRYARRKQPARRP